MALGHFGAPYYSGYSEHTASLSQVVNVSCIEQHHVWPTAAGICADTLQLHAVQQSDGNHQPRRRGPAGRQRRRTRLVRVAGRDLQHHSHVGGAGEGVLARQHQRVRIYRDVRPTVAPVQEQPRRRARTGRLCRLGHLQGRLGSALCSPPLTSA